MTETDSTSDFVSIGSRQATRNSGQLGDQLKHATNTLPTRILDLLLVIVTMPLWGTALAALSAASLLNQGKPILFHHKRLGKNGTIFSAVKFRTMIPNADLHLDSNGVPTTTRITPFGAKLRRSGLDELPQLLNVLRGEMSLVGPRPVVPEWEHKIPGGLQHTRFLVRPGITGPAQVAGRNTVLWSRRLSLDSQYASAPSVRAYLRTLLKTPVALLRPTVSNDRNQAEVDDLG
ncbi:sugar transferase [Dietzia sp. SLG310A2-38A2]|nr:sugar transferase [Dietzia sp. SLG310A2-38A2]